VFGNLTCLKVVCVKNHSGLQSVGIDFVLTKCKTCLCLAATLSEECGCGKSG